MRLLLISILFIAFSTQAKPQYGTVTVSKVISVYDLGEENGFKSTICSREKLNAILNKQPKSKKTFTQNPFNKEELCRFQIWIQSRS
jgi:hypothetical protein